jgi:hypothetical protein
MVLLEGVSTGPNRARREGRKRERERKKERKKRKGKLLGFNPREGSLKRVSLMGQE